MTERGKGEMKMERMSEKERRRKRKKASEKQNYRQFVCLSFFLSEEEKEKNQ